MRGSLTIAHFGAMTHHLLMVHAAMPRRVMVGMMRRSAMILLHRLAMAHHLFVVHHPMTHAVRGRAAAEHSQ